MAATQTKQNTAIQSTEEIAGITFTANAVRSSEVAEHVPVGYRIAHLHEVARAWHTSKEFRDKLIGLSSPIGSYWSLDGSVWTSKIGLESIGAHRITDAVEDGVPKVIFEAINPAESFNLGPKDRSGHYPGKGRVSAGSFSGNSAALVISANDRDECIAPVALVKLSYEELLQQALAQKQVITEFANQFRDLASKLEHTINQNKTIQDETTILKDVHRAGE